MNECFYSISSSYHNHDELRYVSDRLRARRWSAKIVELMKEHPELKSEYGRKLEKTKALEDDILVILNTC